MSSKSHQRVVNVWVKKNVPTPWGVPLEIVGMMEVYKRKKIINGKSGGKTGIFQWGQWWRRLMMDQTKTFLEVNIA